MIGATASLGPLQEVVDARLDRLAREDVVARIWRRDHTVWKPDPAEIENRLGWLTVAESMMKRVADLLAFGEGAASAGLTHALVVGMGGSSLAAEVLHSTFGTAPGALSVLDTTHPAAIQRLEGSMDPSRTLFVVASKSGGTTETLCHLAYLWDKLPRGDHYVAITDPGTTLEELARSRDFRAVFLNPEDIGGRYSALSYFGLVPGALIGVNLRGLLETALQMVAACGESVPAEENPAARLGVALGEAARAGRDKLTLAPPKRLRAFGDWLEQLIAESTGKEGVGIVPVVGEGRMTEGHPNDRLFVDLGEADDGTGIGGEFFRWELATAIAGHVLGINPFDQPNVEESKEATREVLGGSREQPPVEGLPALLENVKPPDYIAIQAYLDPSPEVGSELQRVRLLLRDRYRVATTFGFGPRFLHSTGQLHKGGPDTGVFIQVVDEERTVDLPIPGVPYSFGELIDAQALGDLRSLRARGRRVGRVTFDRLKEVL